MGLERALSLLIENHGDPSMSEQDRAAMIAQIAAAFAPKPSKRSASRLAPHTNVFSEKAQGGLEKQGYRICELTGMSITDHRANGADFSLDESFRLRGEDVPSYTGQVAVPISPEEFFLKECKNEAPIKQFEVVQAHYKALARKIKDIRVGIGHGADYVELLRKQLNAEYRLNMGRVSKDELLSILTKTRTDMGYFMTVSPSRASASLSLMHINEAKVRSRICAAPLIYPA